MRCVVCVAWEGMHVPDKGKIKSNIYLWGTAVAKNTQYYG